MSDVTYADIIRTVNNILKEIYPKITRYGNDTVDKAVPPYFFVECIPAGVNRQTKNMMNKSCSVMITYAEYPTRWITFSKRKNRGKAGNESLCE